MWRKAKQLGKETVHVEDFGQSVPPATFKMLSLSHRWWCSGLELHSQEAQGSQKVIESANLPDVPYFRAESSLLAPEVQNESNGIDQ